MIKSSANLKLLPPEALLKTGEVDHANWNYRPFLGTISRTRFRLALSLLPEQRVGRLLEVGYGSGVFMPELAERCEELYGIDIHTSPEQVMSLLAGFNVRARLYSGSVSAMPFADNFFDSVVAISSLEFIEDLAAACLEMKRVLAPGGFLVAITPGHSPVVDFGLKVLTGKSAKDDFGDRRQAILPTLQEHFTTVSEIKSPAFGNSVVCLYTALKLSPRKM